MFEFRNGIACDNDPFQLTSWSSHRNNARNRELDNIIERPKKCWTGNIRVIVEKLVLLIDEHFALKDRQRN